MHADRSNLIHRIRLRTGRAATSQYGLDFRMTARYLNVRTDTIIALTLDEHHTHHDHIRRLGSAASFDTPSIKKANTCLAHSQSICFICGRRAIQSIRKNASRCERPILDGGFAIGAVCRRD